MENADAKLLSGEWIKEFMDIAIDYRCNPIDHSPPLAIFFYADKMNIHHLDKALALARNGQTKKLSKKEIFYL